RNPATLSPVNPETSSSARTTCNTRSSRSRDRSSATTLGPGPATRLPIWIAESQSASRAACDPIDQSTSAIGSTGRASALARRFLPRGQHPGALRASFRDAAIGSLGEELFERRVVDSLVDGYLRALLRRSRSGGGRRR